MHRTSGPGHTEARRGAPPGGTDPKAIQQHGTPWTGQSVRLVLLLAIMFEESYSDITVWSSKIETFTVRFTEKNFTQEIMLQTDVTYSDITVWSSKIETFTVWFTEKKIHTRKKLFECCKVM